MDDAYKKIDQELSRTAVISDEFKRWILGWCVELASQAYYRGVEEGKRQAAVIEQ